MKKTITRKKLIVGKRKHGFRRRMRTASGRKILKHRRRQGRSKLAA